jgi:hypothetical protein
MRSDAEIRSAGLASQPVREWLPAPVRRPRLVSFGAQVCKAINALEAPKRATILKKHIARIDDCRLRRVFQAAVEFERRLQPTAAENKRQKDFWTGFRS